MSLGTNSLKLSRPFGTLQGLEITRLHFYLKKHHDILLGGGMHLFVWGCCEGTIVPITHIPFLLL
jgi:hypothetical protein